MNKLRLAASLLLIASMPLFAEPPASGTDTTVCAYSSSGETCYLSDINGVNQPLDTQTRGLGVPNRLIESDMNMFMNPGQLMNYGTAYLEGWLGGNLVWGGATVPLPANQKLAVFVRRPLNANSALGSTQALFDKFPQAGGLTSGVTGYAGDFTGAQLGILNKTNKGFGNLDLMYGMALGDMNLGLRLSYANMRNGVDTAVAATGTVAKYMMSAHNIGLGLGVQWKNLGPGYLDLSLSSDLPLMNIDYNTTTTTGSESTTVKSSAAPSIGFLARYVMPVGQDRLIIAANIDQYKMPYEIRGASLAAAAISHDASASALNLALDAAYHQMFQEGKLKVIYSAGVGSASVTYTTVNNVAQSTLSFEKDHFYIPVGVAVEHKTFETFKTRMGVRKNVFSTKTSTDKTATQTITTDRAFFGEDELIVAMGLGWTPAEKVNIDFAMNANAFNPATFFSAVSARYHY